MQGERKSLYPHCAEVESLRAGVTSTTEPEWFASVTFMYIKTRSFPVPDLIYKSYQMCGNLFLGFSRPHHYSCIRHCSAFTSIMHNHPSLLYRHSSFIQCSFHTIHPSHLCPSSQPHTSHIRSHYLLHQLVFLHSIHVIQTTSINSTLLDQPTLSKHQFYTSPHPSLLTRSLCVASGLVKFSIGS